MPLIILIVGTIPGYFAAWFALSQGSSWLMALLVLSGVGTLCTLILAMLIASAPRGPRAPSAMPVSAALLR